MLFLDFGVYFIDVNDRVDSTRGENEFTTICNVFNEMYARDTSKKIHATFQSKGKSGEHLTTIPPYGYIKDPNNKKRSGLSTRKLRSLYSRLLRCVFLAWDQRRLQNG